ncbi:MAG TPA: ATP-binding protein [Spirochaetota bacterium]|nr:ATP-binding protein [Spirochaetota bacterium]HOM38733.1 ATP-binding protein [Spirochaetota bacterium]HPQ49531.1 ATP-binding protein [Spirochaetota bacterium]
MVKRIMFDSDNIIFKIRENKKKSISKEIANVLYSLSKEATKIINADRATLYIYDKEKEELFSYVVSKLEIDEIRLKIGEGIAGRAALLREPIIENNAPSSIYFNPFYDSQTNYRTKQIITNPLINDQDELIGVIQLLNKNSGEFNNEDLEKLKILSKIITIAIEQMKITIENTILKEYNRRLIENLDTGVVVIDNNNKIQDWNTNFLKIFNLDEDVYGKNIIDVIDRLKEYLSDNSNINKEIRINKKYFHIISSSLKDINNNNLGKLFIITDITERVLESKKRETEERMSILGKMTSQLIHDIKNPLFVLRGYIKLINQSNDFNDIQKYTTTMDKEILRIIDITQEILDFSKGDIDIWVEEVSLDRLNSMLIEIIKELNASFQINIRYLNNIKEDIKLKLDLNKIERSLRNIFVNSIEAFSGTDKKVEILIELKTNNNEVEIYVKDKGIGIPPEIREDIFKLFFTNKRNGTGLGLSIAKTIIDKHKGTITLIDDPEWSTTFKITLPIFK